MRISFSSASYVPVKAGHSGRMKKHVLRPLIMKGLRKIMRVSWTAKKTNEWVLNKAGVTRMWANAQPDGRPAKHRWRPLFNAAKFG